MIKRELEQIMFQSLFNYLFQSYIVKKPKLTNIISYIRIATLIFPTLNIILGSNLTNFMIYYR